MTEQNKNLDFNQLIANKFDVKLSREEINYIYNLGAKRTEIGDFHSALPIFQFLVLFDTRNPLYIKAVAGCMQNLDRFLEAYTYYQIAYEFDKEGQQDCLFYMAFCAIKQNMQNEAGKLLDEFITKNPSHEFTKKAKLLRHGIQKTKES